MFKHSSNNYLFWEMSWFSVILKIHGHFFWKIRYIFIQFLTNKTKNKQKWTKYSFPGIFFVQFCLHMSIKAPDRFGVFQNLWQFFTTLIKVRLQLWFDLNVHVNSFMDISFIQLLALDFADLLLRCLGSNVWAFGFNFVASLLVHEPLEWELESSVKLIDEIWKILHC